MRSSQAKKEWRTLEPYLRTAREAEAAAADIDKAVKKVDFMRKRLQDRVSKASKHFIGRAWLAKRLVTSLGKLTPRKVILITGIGGTGKSFFFDRLLDTKTCRKLGGNWARLHHCMLARHCCMFKYSDSLNVNKFLDSLIGQLLRAIKDSGRTFTLDDEYKSPVDKLLCDHLDTPEHTDAPAIVAEVLVPAFEAVGSAKALGGKCIILVDSLDEAQHGDKIVSVLIELIEKSSGWLRWVATSRPDAAVKASLKPVEGGSIELSLEGKNQEADVREYVNKALNLPSLYTSIARYLRPLVPALEQAMVICEKAKGLFKYAVMAVEKLKADPEMDVHSLPEGLDEMFMTYFHRKYGDKLREYDKYTAPMLAIMVATYDAVSPDLVRGDRVGPREEWAKLLEHWDFVKVNICEKRLLTEGKPLIQFGHKSIVDFLQNEDKAGVFAVDVGLGHMLLAARCKKVLKLRSEPTDPCMQYTLRHLVHHLCYLHEYPYHQPDGSCRPDPLQEAAHVLLNFDWLLGRLFLDKDTQGVVEDMGKVLYLLKARESDSDTELAKCIDVVQTMVKRARRAVRHDPRQIMGRIMLELSSDTRAPVVELVKRTNKCKRFRWWCVHKDTLKIGGEGQDLACIGDYAFAGQCQARMGQR